jgi:hypothetical protein
MNLPVHLKLFYRYTALDDWNKVKFTLPMVRLDLTANKANPKEVIFDGYNYTNINNSFKDSNNMLQRYYERFSALADADGTYTLDLRATRGNRTGGCAAGWTLVVIYESPTLPSKFILTAMQEYKEVIR